MSWDEAGAQANAASPPDAPILKIRARAADSILGSASFETVDQDSGRRWPFLFERLLRFGPRVALAASLVGFTGVAGAYFSAGQLPFSARTPQPAGPQPGGERAEILRMVHQMANEIGALKARVEAVHAQSTSAKEATALEGLKARLGAVKTEASAEIAELAGKVNRLQSEVTTKLAKESERFDRRDHRGAVPRTAATKAPRGDAFDASQNPGAPGAPRPLGSLAPAAKGPGNTF
jgi:hypothetical protein